MMKQLMGWAALLCGAAASTGAQAEACWNQRAVEAAQIREFDIMLMVSALRCQVKGTDFVADYNRFVTGHKTTLVSVNDEIRAHLNVEMGGKAALDAYDRLSTSMANRYGNGGGMEEDCEGLRAIAVNAAASGAESTRALLLAHAQRVGVDPALAGGRCAVLVAENQAAVPAPAPVARIATAEPVPFQTAAAVAASVSVPAPAVLAH
ncbi:MAG: hypothetical protein QM690_22365 [Sphingobium sp.]